ncbi:MAG: histidine phosphatase family protein [Coriobacteriales bacterium]|jgi:alpha-ribazole phosphatase|nr:histidine phosphatase family protein [Coriobacteriales bacterium]
MEVLLIRHAETEANRARRYAGRTDEPINDNGIKHAQRCLYPAVESVYVSPLQRTQQTAALLFPHKEQTVVADLIEMDFGDFESLTAEELASNPDYQNWVDSFCESKCPNGEDRTDFDTRVCNAFDAIIAEAYAQGIQNLAIVAHGGTVMGIMDRQKESDCPLNYDRVTPNCTGYHLKLDPARWEHDPDFLSVKKINGLDWQESHSSFFQHTNCEYFPCHATPSPKDFNCLFCFCPLYALGKQCGGVPEFTDGGIKSCHACTLPHLRESYPYLLKLSLTTPSSSAA